MRALEHVAALRKHSCRNGLNRVLIVIVSHKAIHDITGDLSLGAPVIVEVTCYITDSLTTAQLNVSPRRTAAMLVGLNEGVAVGQLLQLTGQASCA